MSEEIDLNKQTILAALPIFITQIYAFYKIKKTIIGVIILLGVYSPIWLNEIPRIVELGYAPDRLTFLIFCGIMVYFVRRLTNQYNVKLSTQSTNG